MPTLLAVDLGVKTGLALFTGDGRLRWYRSRNFGTAARLRRAVQAILADLSDLGCVVLEGGGPLATIWEHEARRRGIRVVQVAAEEWRGLLLHPSEQRDRRHAKQTADTLARRVIEWSAAPRPTALRHDAAEAILVGLWGTVKLGWLAQVPADLRR